jgi:hypothetical protein
MLTISFETTAYLIGLEESIQLYAQILQIREKSGSFKGNEKT